MPNVSLPFVIDAVAKASLILGVAALTASSLRRASASARHFVWTLGLLSALAAPALSVALPRWELPLITVAASPELDTGAAPTAVAPPLRTRTTPSSATGEDRQPAAAAAVPARTLALPSWPLMALTIWAVGAALIIGRMLMGVLAVQWMSRRMPEVTGAPWLAEAESLARALGLSRVRFLRGAMGTMPMAWGIVRPSIVVPADADAWPADRVRVVLLHELAHVKRRDCLTHLVAQFACAAYWFNPLVWMAARRLRTERERACDDLVLASGTRGSDYADQLLDIARVMQTGRFPVVFAGASLAMAQRSQLEGRLIAILDPTVPRRGLSRARAAAAATVFAAIMLVIASVQPWAEERAAVEPHVAQAAAATASTSTADAAVAPAVAGSATADTQNSPSSVSGAVGRGVAGGVTGGIAGGIAGGVAGGVVEGVAAAIDGITNGIATGVVNAVAESAAEIEREVEQEQEKDKDKDAARGQARDPRTVNALMEALKDSDKGVRETAMHALVQMRDPRMFEPLVAALKDASADVREQAAFGLGQLRDARAITPLGAAVKDADASVREQAVFALGQLRAAGAADAIAQALRDSSPSVREQAAFALGQIRDKKAIEPLISALKDESASVREQAAFALGQLRAATAIEALVIALKDANASVREQVAFALGQIGDPRAIDGLMAALKDTNASVRQQAAFALGQIR